MKQILDFPNYAVTKDGRVWSHKHQKFLKPYVSIRYKSITLCKNNKKYHRLIHRLVLETFIGFCPKGMQCCHNDGNKQNNRLENLRWDTPKANQRDRIKHGTHPVGERNPKAKLTEQDVRMIIYMYKTGLFTQRGLAAIYGVCQYCIFSIINKKSWKHIWRN